MVKIHADRIKADGRVILLADATEKGTKKLEEQIENEIEEKQNILR